MNPTKDPLSSCSNSEPFALQVLGNSMEPEFPEGCIVVIEPTDQCEPGMFVMALVEDTRWFRQFVVDDSGPRLSALNPIYPDIPLAGLDWKVEGIIVQRTLRRHQSADGRRDVKHYEYRSGA